jgi:hypothetical protein
MGSKKVMRSVEATLARREELIPAVTRAMTLIRKSLGLL